MHHITWNNDEINLFKEISTMSETLNIPVYVVGGYVRDKILNRQSKDIDFVCLGDGIEFAQAFQQKYHSDIPLHIFKNFGTGNLHIQQYPLPR